MKIIEGKVQKSKALEKILIQLEGKKILLIDTVNVSALYSLCTELVRFKSNEEMWGEFIDDQKYESFIDSVKANDYDYVIFEVNDNLGTLDNYGAIEEKLGLPIIVTIQNNGLSEIEVYDF